MGIVTPSSGIDSDISSKCCDSCRLSNPIQPLGSSVDKIVIALADYMYDIELYMYNCMVLYTFITKSCFTCIV